MARQNPVALPLPAGKSAPRLIHPLPAMIGIPIGLLIGVISGVVFLLLVRTAWSSQKAVWKVIAQLIAIPGFWFGGPWVTTTLFEQVDLASMLPYYASTLAVVFGLISFRVLLRIIAQIAREVGENQGGSS